MARGLLSGLFAVLCLFPAQGFPVPATSLDDLAEHVDAVAEKLVKCRRLPGLTLAVVRIPKDKKPEILTRGFGYADVGSKRNVSPATRFCVAGATQAFTAALLAQILKENETFSLDTPIHKMMGSAFQLSNAELTAKVTVRDILSHQVGLAPYFGGFVLGYNMTRAELVRRLRYVPAVAPFRDSFVPGPLLYVLAGQLVQTFNDSSWENVITKRFFKPMRMTGSTFADRVPNWAADFALPHVLKEGQPVPILSKVTGNILRPVGPSGSICSTSGDMAQWMTMLLQNGTYAEQQILHPDVVNELFTPQNFRFPEIGRMVKGKLPVEASTVAYNYGWISGTYRGRRRYYLNAFSNYYGSFVTLLPDEGLGIFTAANGPSLAAMDNAFRVLHYYVTDILLGEDPWLDLSSSVCTFPRPWFGLITNHTSNAPNVTETPKTTSTEKRTVPSTTVTMGNVIESRTDPSTFYSTSSPDFTQDGVSDAFPTFETTEGLVSALTTESIPSTVFGNDVTDFFSKKKGNRTTIIPVWMTGASEAELSTLVTEVRYGEMSTTDRAVETMSSTTSSHSIALTKSGSSISTVEWTETETEKPPSTQVDTTVTTTTLTPEMTKSDITTEMTKSDITTEMTKSDISTEMMKSDFTTEITNSDTENIKTTTAESMKTSTESESTERKTFAMTLQTESSTTEDQERDYDVLFQSTPYEIYRLPSSEEPGKASTASSSSSSATTKKTTQRSRLFTTKATRNPFKKLRVTKPSRKPTTTTTTAMSSANDLDLFVSPTNEDLALENDAVPEKSSRMSSPLTTERNPSTEEKFSLPLEILWSDTFNPFARTDSIPISFSSSDSTTLSSVERTTKGRRILFPKASLKNNYRNRFRRPDASQETSNTNETIASSTIKNQVNNILRKVINIGGKVRFTTVKPKSLRIKLPTIEAFPPDGKEVFGLRISSTTSKDVEEPDTLLEDIFIPSTSNVAYSSATKKPAGDERNLLRKGKTSTKTMSVNPFHSDVVSAAFEEFLSSTDASSSKSEVLPDNSEIRHTLSSLDSTITTQHEPLTLQDKLMNVLLNLSSVISDTEASHKMDPEPTASFGTTREATIASTTSLSTPKVNTTLLDAVIQELIQEYEARNENLTTTERDSVTPAGSSGRTTAYRPQSSGTTPVLTGIPLLMTPEIAATLFRSLVTISELSSTIGQSPSEGTSIEPLSYAATEPVPTLMQADRPKVGTIFAALPKFKIVRPTDKSSQPLSSIPDSLFISPERNAVSRNPLVDVAPSSTPSTETVQIIVTNNQPLPPNRKFPVPSRRRLSSRHRATTALTSVTASGNQDDVTDILLHLGSQIVQQQDDRRRRRQIEAPANPFPQHVGLYKHQFFGTVLVFFNRTSGTLQMEYGFYGKAHLSPQDDGGTFKMSFFSAIWYASESDDTKRWPRRVFLVHFKRAKQDSTPSGIVIPLFEPRIPPVFIRLENL